MKKKFEFFKKSIFGYKKSYVMDILRKLHIDGKEEIKKAKDDLLKLNNEIIKLKETVEGLGIEIGKNKKINKDTIIRIFLDDVEKFLEEIDYKNAKNIKDSFGEMKNKALNITGNSGE